MLTIKILYESKYSLGTTDKEQSFLTSMDSIKDDMNKNKRNILSEDNSYIENLKELNEIYPHFKYNDISSNTVLGILSRLVGDVRRLDDILAINNHPITQIKDQISFENNRTYFQNEIVNLHTPPKESQNGTGGLIIKETPLIYNNEFSENLLSVFNYIDNNSILAYTYQLLNKDPKIKNEKYQGVISPINIIKEFNLGLERFKKEDNLKSAITQLLKKEKSVYNIYGVLLYERINYLKYFNLFSKEIEESLNSNGNIPGVAQSSGGLTPKDFSGYYLKEKKSNWNLPYSIKLQKDLLKKESKLNFNANLGITKEGGELLIKIDIDNNESLYIKNLIKEAAVNTFHMGKKGLAYVVEIKESI